MKKTNFYAFVSAALLTCAAGFSACSSDDIMEDSNYLPSENKEVKTEFAINIPRAKSGRMTAENTQNNNNFLGMEGIKLFSMKDSITTTNQSTPFLATTTLANIAQSFNPTSNVKIYMDVSIPLGTGAFLFYGHAPVGKETTAYFNQGILTSNLNETATNSASKIEFNLNTICANTPISYSAITDILNNIAKTTNWSSYSTSDSDPIKKTLGELYKNFTSIKAGSANSVLLTLASLHKTLTNLGTSSNTTDNSVKNDIINNIESAIDKPTSQNSEYSWKDTSIRDENFPANLHLPDGVAVLKFEGQSFSYVNPNNITTSPIQTVAINSLCFPSALYYMANTPLAASKTAQDFPGSWSFTDWGAKVEVGTQKVALKNKINYAVAVLQTNVRFSSNTITCNKKMKNSTDEYVSIPNAGLPVSAVLIGSQPDLVDYKFDPKAIDNETKFTKTIYDKATSLNAVVGMYSKTPNYTLVLPTTNSNKAVHFAIELTNNTQSEFRGADGIVPIGGKFYLVGTLDPDPKATSGVTKPNNTSIEDVFKQDHKTIANITINSFKNAYNCIPDLRATNLELGLSVDLTWETGLQFDVEIN